MKESKFTDDPRCGGAGSSSEFCRRRNLVRRARLSCAEGMASARTPSIVWKCKFAGMQTEDVRRLKELEAENAALKRNVANQALELEATGKLLRKNGLRPPGAGRGPSSK